MLLWTESCQRLRNTTAVARRGYTPGFGPGWSATGGRNNGPVITGFTTVQPIAPAPSGNVFIMGYRFTPNGPWTALWQCRQGTTEQCSVRLGSAAWSNGILTVERAGTILAASPAGLVSTTALQYVAVKIVIHPTLGSSRVYLDGVEVPSLSLNNVNTQGQATSAWDGFGVGAFTGGSGMPWCDLYVMDGTQPHANDPADVVLDARVDYNSANGNGYLSQFTGSDGNSTDNYLLIDDGTGSDPDDDTTYVQKTTAGIDGYAFSNLANPGATIVGVTSFAHIRRLDAGLASARSGLRIGSTNYVGATKSVDLTYSDAYQSYGHDPNNGAWTEAAFNGAEVLLEKV